MDQAALNRREGQGRALLGLASWNDSDIQRAITAHDLIESPDAGPGPVTSALRHRLIAELHDRFERHGDPIDSLREKIFASGVLESPAGLKRRLHLLSYFGATRFWEFRAGALASLDQAVDALEQLEQAVDAVGAKANGMDEAVYYAALDTLAAVLLARYSSRRELLLLEQTARIEKDAIRADLWHAIETSRRVVQSGTESVLASALAILGSCLVLLYEDDPEQHTERVINAAVKLLEDAARKTDSNDGPGERATRLGVLDRLAVALMNRGRRGDVDTAIGLLTQTCAEAGPDLTYVAGGRLSLATARFRRWERTRSKKDEEALRSAYFDAWAAGLVHHLPAAFDAATQQAGWAWMRGRFPEAGEAYARAVTTLHLAVRSLASWPDKQLPLRKAPGIAAMAAFGLVRSGAIDDALVALETGRGVLLAEMFDRRSIDYARIAAFAGKEAASQYQLLTGQITQLEALDLAGATMTDGDMKYQLEALRRERDTLLRGPATAPPGITLGLSAPPTAGELCAAVGPAPVVHIATTAQGGIALVLTQRSSAAVSSIELPELTSRVADELVAAFKHSVAKRSLSGCDEVCEALWRIVMRFVVGRLDGFEHAILVPGGRLSSLPWHAARIPGPGTHHALDSLALSYAPNVRALAAARTAMRETGDPLAVLVIEQPKPTAQTELSTADEIAAVHAQEGSKFRVTGMPGRAATPATLLDAISRFQAIHFAGHAFAQPADPLSSALLMANDEPLTVRDLLTHGVGAARFAVLSACHTASTGSELTDEMINLPTALLQCGLASVVGSLWETFDEPTKLIMKVFYQRWQHDQMPPSCALRAAQVFARDHGFGSPLAWASFVHVGA